MGTLALPFGHRGTEWEPWPQKSHPRSDSEGGVANRAFDLYFLGMAGFSSFANEEAGLGSSIKVGSR